MRVLSRILLLSSLSLISCAGGASGERKSSLGDERVWDRRWPELVDPEVPNLRKENGVYTPRSPDPDQARRLNSALNLYVAQDPGFAAERDALAQEPLTAFWLAHSLTVFTIRALQAEPLPAGEPQYKRPAGELVAMGAAAVPAVMIDLYSSPFGDDRLLAAEILGEMGPEALSAWSFALEVGDARLRRLGMQVLAGWDGAPPAMPFLEAGARDGDFGVRAAAWRGMVRAGRGDAARTALREESDGFVRRAIADELPRLGDRASAEALVAYLERCAASSDLDGARAARASLERMAADGRKRSVSGWRAWLAAAEFGTGESTR